MLCFLRNAFILLLIIFPFYDYAADKTDSLFTTLRSLKGHRSAATDTMRVRLLNEISRDFIKSGDHERSIQYADSAKKIAEDHLSSTGDKLPGALNTAFNKGVANAYHNIGTVHYFKGDYDKALQFYMQSLEIREKINDQQGSALSANNIGNIYNNQGDYVKALDYYLRSLKVREKLNDKKGMAASYNNIGAVYEMQKDFSKALEYFSRSLKIRQEIGDKQGTALSLNNIGNVLYYTDNYKDALNNYKRSLEIRIGIGDKQGTADCYHNMSNIYHKKGDVTKALEFQDKALAIRRELGDLLRMCFSYRNIGSIYLESHKPQLAKENILKSIELAKEISALPDLMSGYRALAKVDSALGDHRQAFEHYKLFIRYKDSLNNVEITKKLVQSELKYEFEKKEQATQLEQEKKDAVNRAALEQQRLQRNGFIAGFALTLALAGVSYRNYRNKRKATEIITRQKEILEEKNKDIVDSINYARRIQMALLKEEEHVSKHLPEHFIIFRPKDIVSGDFYWVNEKKGYLYVAVADCTGHGVPGAFMSMLGIAFLNEIAASDELLEPGVILDRLREKIVKELSQQSEAGSTGGMQTVKDGMDISLIRLELNSGKAMWSGANNSLYIISSGNQLKEIKPDKQPIGFHVDPKPFTTHLVETKPGDMLYLFTDGYADQFGGEKGKKFKYSQLKETLTANCLESVTVQKSKLEQAFLDWKGNHEQVDDICMVGLRIEDPGLYR